MHLFLVILISLLATFENVLPSIVGFQQSSLGSVFLGTVHHSDDYFYYLSQFSQGATRWLTTTNLYTSETTPDTFVGWSNVLTGHLFHLVGISAIPAYQISIAIWTFLLCLSAYKLALIVFNDKHKALLSLFLFVLYHSFPIIRDTHWTYADYWNNFSVPRVRFGGVPHQLLLNILSIQLISLLLQKKKLLMTLSSFLLASLQPVLWLLITAATGVTSLIHSMQTSKKSLSSPHYFLFPLLLFFSGLPAAIYLQTIFATLPFSQLKLWEASQYIPLTLTGFILSMGPIFLIALCSLPAFLSKRTYARLGIVIFSVLSLLVFMSPIPHLLGIVSVRCMSTLVILCISIIATEGLYAVQHYFLQRVHRSICQFVSFVILVVLFVVLLPNHLEMLKKSTQFDRTNAYEFLSSNDVSFIKSMTTIGTPSDTFLVLWPYNAIFPALSAKKSFNGHPLLTIHPTEKNALAAKFYDQQLSTEDVKQFFATYNIRYVVAYPWQMNLKQLPYLHVLKETQNLVLYKVLLYP